MASRREIVEYELGVRLPDQYARYLEEYGIYDVGGDEVYGIHEELLGYDGIPCVIGGTRLWREIHGYAEHFIMLQATGFESEVILLDTQSGEVFLCGFWGMHKIADCFDEWFEKEILARHREWKE